MHAVLGNVARLARILLLGGFLGVMLVGCGERKPIVSESFVFGTRVEIQIADNLPETQVRAATAQVLAEFDRLHRTYHAWQPSALTELNDALQAGQLVRVDDEMASLLLGSQAYTRQSDALFDPGIGRLIGLWGFHADSYVAQLPDPVELKRWLNAHPSILQLQIQQHAKGADVWSPNPAVALDFGGSLKGTALDRAAALLRAAGIRNALINIGGNVMALGARNGKPWRVAIQSPRSAGPLAVLELRDGEATGTSGDYQRYFEVDGRRYPHLLDPRTAYPAEGTQAVTLVVSGPDAGVRSDVLTKPLFIAGEAGWQAMAEQLGVNQVLRVNAAGRVAVTAPLADRLKFMPHDGKLPDIQRIE